MNKILIVAAIIIIGSGVLGMISPQAQADTFVELGAGYNRNLTGCSSCWEDAGAGPFGAYLRLGHDWEVTEDIDIGMHWVHLSQWSEGPPFNENVESSVDHLGVYVRYTF